MEEIKRKIKVIKTLNLPKNHLVRRAAKCLVELKKQGKDINEIVEVIRQTNFPLGQHLWIMNNLDIILQLNLK